METWAYAKWRRGQAPSLDAESTDLPIRVFDLFSMSNRGACVKWRRSGDEDRLPHSMLESWNYRFGGSIDIQCRTREPVYVSTLHRLPRSTLKYIKTPLGLFLYIERRTRESV